MEKGPVKINWEKPQRQPLAGLLVVFVKNGWQLMKSLWPFILLSLFSARGGKTDKYDVLLFIIAGIAVAGSILRFLFFTFHIRNEELTINKGWLKKDTLVIPLSKIQSVHIEQGLLHQVLGIVKLSIDTAGSTQTEVKIDALHRQMADALQAKLLSQKGAPDEPAAQPFVPLLKLSDADLFKLSLSANHLEAFFILLSFSIGIMDNLSQLNIPFIETATGMVPRASWAGILFFLTLILLFTVSVSTLRIFFKFYRLTVWQSPSGFYVKAGLTNVKERMVPFKKIQFLSWKANWIRKKLDLRLLQYHSIGGDDIQNKMKVQVPVTQLAALEPLTSSYCTLPLHQQPAGIRIHPVYVVRKTLISGALPLLFLLPLAWTRWEQQAFFLLLLPFLVCLFAWLYQRRFTLLAFTNAFVINKGYLGEEKIIAKWYKVQSVSVKQSLYQKKKKLATLVMYTAAGRIVIPYIREPAAYELLNYTLYQIESRSEPWM